MDFKKLIKLAKVSKKYQNYEQNFENLSILLEFAWKIHPRGLLWPPCLHFFFFSETFMKLQTCTKALLMGTVSSDSFS